MSELPVHDGDRPTIPRMATTQGPSRNLGRLSEIAQVAARHGFGYFLGRNRLSDNDSNGDAITVSIGASACA